ncbi:hypothetical protein [Methylothermus subterraneus]
MKEKHHVVHRCLEFRHRHPKTGANPAKTTAPSKWVRELTG